MSYRKDTNLEINCHVAGALAGETDSALILKHANEVETHVPRSEVKEFRASQMSMMPEGFEAVLSEQDLADLVGYLHAPESSIRRLVGLSIKRYFIHTYY